MVTTAWNVVVESDGNPMITLYKRLTNIKTALKQLNRDHFWNISGRVKETESILTTQIARLQEDPFNDTFISNSKETKDTLLQLLKSEEAYYSQKTAENWIQLGDNNTKFFHSKMKERRARSKVTCLMDEAGGKIVGQKKN